MKKCFLSFFSAMMVIFIVLSLLSPTLTAAADWKPSKPISLLVGYGPGGGFDIWARAIASVLTKQVGVPVVVKNVPGLGGVTVMETFQRTKADGHSIVIFELASMLIAQYVTKAQFDLTKFVPIGVANVGTRALWAAKNSPFNSIQDAVKAGKTRTLRGGTTGLSSGLWLCMAVFASEAGMDVKPVAGYSSGAELLAALEAGDFDLLVIPPTSALPFLKRGTIKSIALGGSSPDPRLPGTPTFAQAGYPKTSSFAVALRSVSAPPGTPPAAAAFLEKSLTKALHSPEFIKWLESQGEDNKALNAKEMSKLTKESNEIVKEFLPVLGKYFK